MISTEFTPANQALVLQFLASAPGRLAEICQGISEAQARRAPESSERSLVEIVAHLLNSEARSAEALFQALLLNEPLIPPIHPERLWGPLARYERLLLADQIAYFRLRRAVLLPVLTALTVEQWDRRVQEHDKQRRESVYWRARSLALHEQEHLAEIERRFSRSEK